MRMHRIGAGLILLYLTIAACGLSSPAGSSDAVSETLMAEAANAQSTGQALAPTVNANQTQAALPTATMTPLGTLFDAGDGLPTTLILNIEDVTTGMAHNFVDLQPGEAHNYLLRGTAGMNVVVSTSQDATSETFVPVHYLLLSPDGTILLDTTRSVTTLRPI